MASIDIADLTVPESTKLLRLEESHFADLKAMEIAPSKLTRSMSAFANAEGGELFIGIDERMPTRERTWRGFNKVEDANGFLQMFENVFPFSQEHLYSFLRSPAGPGYVLKAEIRKSREIKKASDGKVYIRRGAQNLPVETEEALASLRRNKGIVSFETEPVNADKALITNSTHIIQFMLEVVPTAEPEPWLKKQQVIIEEKPTVAGLVLFAEDLKRPFRNDAA